MYHDFFGIAENPFSITPDPRYLYMSKGHQEALAHLLYGVKEGGGFVLLTGEVGTGKTSVCRCLLEQLPETADVALILNPRLDEIELLASICDELGVAYPAKTRSLKVLVDRLNSHLLEVHAKGRHAVVIIDEAQNLSAGVLEQVRLLTNLETATRKLLQIILIGQPELIGLLERDEMRQVVQRITARYHLRPLNRGETRAYIAHRLAVGGLAPDIFGPAALNAIYRRARGVPRLINSLCDRCLLGAYAQNRKSVGPRMVRQATKEVLGKSRGMQGPAGAALPWVATAAVLAAALVIVDPADLSLLSGIAGPAEDVETPALDPSEASATGGIEVAQAEPPDPTPVEPATPEASDATRTEDAEVAAVPESPAEAERQTPPPVIDVDEVQAASMEIETVETAETAAVERANPDAAAETEPIEPAVAETAPPERAEPAAAEMSPVAVAAAPPVDSGVAPPAASSAAAAPDELPARETEGPLEAQPAAVAAPAGPDMVRDVEASVTAAPDANGILDREPESAASPSLAPAQTAALSDPVETVPVGDLTLDGLFDQGAVPVDGETAFAALLELWGLEAQGVDGDLDCSRSTDLGVKCMVGKTAWDILLSFNRPAVLTLKRSNGRWARVVLTSVDGKRVTLRAGARRIVTDPESLRPLWNGDYLLLWRPPEVYRRMLALGTRGKDVAWLEDRLAAFQGEPLSETPKGVFDTALREKVMAFQKSRGLKSDGIVGTRTLIHLNTVAQDSGVPLLQPSAR
jgi:general secretion pathway protein A